jgi:hypothetical protein
MIVLCVLLAAVNDCMLLSYVFHGYVVCVPCFSPVFPSIIRAVDIDKSYSTRTSFILSSYCPHTVLILSAYSPGTLYCTEKTLHLTYYSCMGFTGCLLHALWHTEHTIVNKEMCLFIALRSVCHRPRWKRYGGTNHGERLKTESLSYADRCSLVFSPPA